MSDQHSRTRRRQGRSRTTPDAVVDPPAAGGAPGRTAAPAAEPASPQAETAAPPVEAVLAETACVEAAPDAAAPDTAAHSETAATALDADAVANPAPDSAVAGHAEAAETAESEAVRRSRESGDGGEIPWHMRPWSDEDAPASAAGAVSAAGDGSHGGDGRGGDGRGHPAWPPEVQPHHHAWVYAMVGLFLLALGFGAWGLWTVFRPIESLGGDLRAQNERLKQEVSTLRRSDQISREANRDLQRTLAERDEEIAGLRADVAFYERFVGATGQRRGLSVHELKLQPERDDAWRFVATLTQNLNRGAINSGRLTVAVEGTRDGRLQRLAWSQLRQQTAEPGLEYSFKYFQQVEGNLILPAGFEPLRVTVRLVPEGGSAVEQSFPWTDVAAAARAQEAGAR